MGSVLQEILRENYVATTSLKCVYIIGVIRFST